MQYYEVLGTISEGKINKLQDTLQSSKKNRLVSMYRDYYQGYQWLFNGEVSSTTRSGKLMWKEKDVTSNFKGFTAGELKCWNLVQPSIDIYSSYVRGTTDDSTTIEVGKELAKLGELLNKHFDNSDEIVIRTTRRMSNDGNTVWKFTTSGVEIVDLLQVTPVYNGDKKVGTIRQYEVSASDPMVRDNPVGKAKTYIYTEIWIPSQALLEKGKGDFNLYKFINKTQIEQDKIVSPYAFDPHIVIANKRREFGGLSEDGTDISDTEQIIEIQDDWNAYQTDIGIINRQVAFPLFRTVSSLWEQIIEGKLDSEGLRKELEKVSIRAGSIINAPIERMETSGLPQSSVSYVEYMLEQLYRVTGIPKGVFVSDGGSNVAAETVMYQMESLRRRIDEKRTNIEQGVKEYAKMIVSFYFENANVDSRQIEDGVIVTWAEIMSQGKKERADLLLQAVQQDALPKEYVLEKILAILGESEDLNRVLGMLMSNNQSSKIAIELQKLKDEMGTEMQSEMDKKTVEIEAMKKERGLLVDEVTKLLE